MRGKILALFFGMATFAASTQAQAQLQQPHCGGWPPGRGQPGIIIGGPGVTCYGQIANRVGRRSMVTDIEVVRPPQQGVFRMIGTRDFEYRPNATMRGNDIIIVRGGHVRDGKDRPYRLRFRATTDANYSEQGGTTTTAPEKLRRGFNRRDGGS